MVAVPKPSPYAAQLAGSGIRAIMERARRAPGPVVSLHIGEPGFPTPPHVGDAIAEAQARGETGYAPSAGLPALRDAISAKLASANDLALRSERVVVTAGGTQALHLGLTVVLRPGDDVLVPDPGWPNAGGIVRLLAARPRGYPLRKANGFLPDVDELARLVGPRTRAILVNSPANPVATVLDGPLLERLVRLAHERDLWILSDECYEAFTFDGPHVSTARADPDGRVLTCFSFSKTHGMTGLRVGYLVLPEVLAPLAVRAQEAMLACVGTPVQYGALAALTGPQDHVDRARTAYLRRRDEALELLRATAVPYAHPAGAYYLWLRVHTSDTTSFAVRLLDEQRVAVAPGRAFGDHGEGWVRLSLAAPAADLVTGIERLVAFGAEAGSSRHA
ncbi:aminotransferase class I/II-fold pyridoxal phosphate-dependent enzyme [Micromonospora sp. KC213]|nr:aminotransferase class I/II-fold pyridoxal phosphate-dependent enzyme [Micromonospora sp. KC213]